MKHLKWMKIPLVIARNVYHLAMALFYLTVAEIGQLLYELGLIE